MEGTASQRCRSCVVLYTEVVLVLERHRIDVVPAQYNLRFHEAQNLNSLFSLLLYFHQRSPMRSNAYYSIWLTLTILVECFFTSDRCGTIETLETRPQKAGVDVRQLMKDFVKRNYYAESMKLCVFGTDMKELERMVRTSFSGIPTRAQREADAVAHSPSSGSPRNADSTDSKNGVSGNQTHGNADQHSRKSNGDTVMKPSFSAPDFSHCGNPFDGESLRNVFRVVPTKDKHEVCPASFLSIAFFFFFVTQNEFVIVPEPVKRALDTSCAVCGRCFWHYSILLSNLLSDLMLLPISFAAF